MSDEVIDLDHDNDLKFNHSEWIGTGKTFPQKTIPPYIDDAYTRAFDIAPDLREHLLPSKNIPASEFIHHLLPQQSAALSFVKAKIWFSLNRPTVGLFPLMMRDTPDASTLRELRRVAGQRWLDGCQSICDPQYNRGTERLPLSALTLWEELASAKACHDHWSRCQQWLSSGPAASSSQ